MSLSHQTVAKRMAELSDSMILQLKEVVQQCNYFSQALDVVVVVVVCFYLHPKETIDNN